MCVLPLESLILGAKFWGYRILVIQIVIHRSEKSSRCLGDWLVTKRIRGHSKSDASNLFYGGEKSLGWKIDYEKLFEYLKEKYKAEKIFYFGGVEIHNFPYDYQKEETVPVDKLDKYLADFLKNKGERLDEATILLIGRHLKRVRFYRKLESFGYKLFLKPVKLYEQEDETTKRKANCDVDMAFHLMKEVDDFDKVLILSGDGDFLPVLKYLREIGKEVLLLARSPRTAREIRQFAGSNFRDFEYLRELLKRK